MVLLSSRGRELHSREAATISPALLSLTLFWSRVLFWLESTAPMVNHLGEKGSLVSEKAWHQPTDCLVWHWIRSPHDVPCAEELCQSILMFRLHSEPALLGLLWAFLWSWSEGMNPRISVARSAPIKWGQNLEAPSCFYGWQTAVAALVIQKQCKSWTASLVILSAISPFHTVQS